MNAPLNRSKEAIKSYLQLLLVEDRTVVQNSIDTIHGYNKFNFDDVQFPIHQILKDLKELKDPSLVINHPYNLLYIMN